MRHHDDIVTVFYNRIHKIDGGCWIWIGTRDSDGYGRLRFQNKIYYTHRLSFQIHKDKNIEGFDIHHDCENPSCVNPDHLKKTTRREHLMLGRSFVAENASKNHCPNGHPYDQVSNLRGRFRQRICSICSRKKSLRYYHKNKENSLATRL